MLVAQERTMKTSRATIHEVEEGVRKMGKELKAIPAVTGTFPDAVPALVITGVKPHQPDAEQLFKDYPNLRQWGWVVELRYQGRRMEIPFWQGLGHEKPPTLADVITCLAFDAQSASGQTFETWAEDLGYDTDSRKALHIFEEVRDQAARFQQLLGEALFDELCGLDEEALMERFSDAPLLRTLSPAKFFAYYGVGARGLSV
jgi:hypothetical protein